MGENANFGIGDVIPTRTLVVTAHPDDVDFGTAGTVAHLTDLGSDVTYCVATDGDAGEAPGVPRERVAELRHAEQRAAALEVGVSDVRFLGWPDGQVQPTLELRRAISRVIRQVRPDLVISQSPERRWDRIYASHPDHLAVAEAAVCAVYPDSRNPHAHPELSAEGLEPHAVPELWVMGLQPTDVHVDITETVGRKLAALRSHRSQTSDYPLEEMIRAWGELVAAEGGLGEGRLAESFRRVNTA